MLKKSILIFGAFIFLVFAGSSVSAVTEGTGDIWHCTGVGVQTVPPCEPYSGEKAYIDLTGVDYSVLNSDVTVTLTVSGPIQKSTNVVYTVYLVGDEGNYSLTYVNNFVNWLGFGGYEGESGYILEPNFTTSDTTFTATFAPIHTTDSFEIWGFAWEFDTVAKEAWEDWIPDFHSPYYTPDDDDDDDNPPVDDDDDNPPADDDDDGTVDTQGEDDDKDKGIPGFEIVTIIAAIAVALILLRRKK